MLKLSVSKFRFGVTQLHVPCVAVTTTFSAGTFAAHGAAPDVEVADFEAYLAGAGAWLLAEEAG